MIKKYRFLTCAILLALLFCGCKSEKNVIEETETDSSVVSSSEVSFEENTEGSIEEEDSEGYSTGYVTNDNLLNRPFVVYYVDTGASQMMLKDIQSTRQFLYRYTLNTSFMDKYGGLVSVTSFTPGKVAVIDSMDGIGTIRAMRLSDEVWELDKIENYNIDLDRGVFTIGVTNYRIPDNVMVFSDNYETGMDSIGQSDVLRVTGKDKDIWSVSITTGHGTLNLINTEAFDGSLICVGNVYAMINGNTSIEVPEGTYNITVANKGYGGSAAVEVHRGGSVVLDLNTIKGAEPEKKYCNLTFVVEVEDAVVKIDGEKVNIDEQLSVEYGKHTLSVSAPGYEKWTKTLYVNSETAKILLELEEENTNKNNSSDDSSDGNESGSDTNNTSTQTNNSGNSGSTTDNNRQDVELDYLTTIRDTVSNIMNSVNN